jgi:hypothetical protein
LALRLVRLFFSLLVVNPSSGELPLKHCGSEMT